MTATRIHRVKLLESKLEVLLQVKHHLLLQKYCGIRVNVLFSMH